MEKYNKIWLKTNNMTADWHEIKSKWLQDKIDQCQTEYLKLHVPDNNYWEAFVPVLNTYRWTKGLDGIVTIVIK